MKKSLVQTLFIAAVLMFSAQTFAFNSTNPDGTVKTEVATDSLRKEVSQMVKDADLWGNNITDAEVIVQFSVDEAGAVMLKKIISESDYLKEYVTENINQKKITVSGVEANVNYYLKISFKARV
jgi:hypothetical protein